MSRRGRRSRNDPKDPTKHRATHLSDSVYRLACRKADRLGISYSAYVAQLIERAHERSEYGDEESE